VKRIMKKTRSSDGVKRSLKAIKKGGEEKT